MALKKGDVGRFVPRTKSWRPLRSSAGGPCAVRACLCAVLPFLVLLSSAGGASPADDKEVLSRYIVIDAGSSGCRVHVYVLRQQAGQRLPIVELPDKRLKKSPGLSSFASNPGDAGVSLAALLEFANKHVPAAERPTTPIRLAATAGLRLLPKDKAEAILDSCYKFLKEKSTFLVSRDKISVISGRDEGAYGWLSINFLLNRLDGMSAASEGTMGTIEMGGASSQVTVQLKGKMAESTPDPSTTYTVNVAGSEYVLYTHSYLGFGQEQARTRYNNLLKGPAVEDPCFQKGYSVAFRSPDAADNLYDQYAGRRQGDFNGGGNFSACTSGMDELFTEVNPALKLAATCKTPPCAFGGVHQPRFWEGGQLASSLVLFENFFHSSNALNMPSGAGTAVTIEDFAAVGRKWCSLAWSFAEKTGDAGSPEHSAYPQMEEEKEKKMCFSMAYMTSFLTALGIPSKFPMSIMGDIKATPLEWALGIMLADLTSAPSAPADSAAIASQSLGPSADPGEPASSSAQPRPPPRGFAVSGHAHAGAASPLPPPGADLARSPQEKADKVRSKQAQMMAGLGAGIGGGKVSGGTAKGAADAGKAHKMAGPSTYWGSTELGVLVMLLAIAAVGLTFRRRRNLRRDSRESGVQGGGRSLTDVEHDFDAPLDSWPEDPRHDWRSKEH